MRPVLRPPHAPEFLGSIYPGRISQNNAEEASYFGYSDE
jgi:hypothetical protein